MTRANLDAAIAIIWLVGMFAAIAMLAWLVHVEAGEGAVAAVATLVGSLVTHGAGILRNRFPARGSDDTPTSQQVG